jgi:hypothetical protein
MQQGDERCNKSREHPAQDGDRREKAAGSDWAGTAVVDFWRVRRLGKNRLHAQFTETYAVTSAERDDDQTG